MKLMVKITENRSYLSCSSLSKIDIFTSQQSDLFMFLQVSCNTREMEVEWDSRYKGSATQRWFVEKRWYHSRRTTYVTHTSHTQYASIAHTLTNQAKPNWWRYLRSDVTLAVDGKKTKGGLMCFGWKWTFSKSRLGTAHEWQKWL